MNGYEITFGVGWWTGRWVETGLVGLAGTDGFGHFVVDFEDGLFGDVAALLGDFA